MALRHNVAAENKMDDGPTENEDIAEGNTALVETDEVSRDERTNQFGDNGEHEAQAEQYLFNFGINEPMDM